MHRKRAVLALKLLFATSLIAWLVFSGKIDFDLLANVKAGWPWFLVALIPFGGVLLVGALRWRLLLRAQNIHYSFSEVFSLSMIGLFFNQFLMGTTGGDLVKAYMVAREHPDRRSAGVMAVFVDRAVGLLVLVMVALVAMAFHLPQILDNPWLSSVAAVVAGIFSLSLLGGYVFYSERVRSPRWARALLLKLPFRGSLARLSEAVYIYKFHLREVGLAVLLSVMLHLMIVTMNILLAALVLQVSANWLEFFFLIPVAQIAMALPINPPGALGTGEWIYETMLPFAGVAEGGMLICLLQRCVYYVGALPGCIYYLKRKKQVEQAVDAARAADETTAGVSGSNRSGSDGDDGSPTDGSRGVRTELDPSASET